MKVRFKLFLFTTLLIFVAAKAIAQEPQTRQTYFLARVTQIIDDRQSQQDWTQTVRLLVLTGDEKGKELTIDYGSTFSTIKEQKVKANETIIGVKIESEDETLYFIADKYRIPFMLLILVFFFALVVALSRFKGFNSFVGLFFTILILVKFIVPQILLGANPLLIAVIGSVATAFFSLYMAHGISVRTTLSLISTLLSLALSAFMAVVFVNGTRLFGVGSEEAFFLLVRSSQEINLRGILLAGIIIGALGVLDDITTAQTATVDEIKKANVALSFAQLYKSSISVGKEHISSLVNTLVLAYAGSSMPLFLIFSLDKERPLWVILNSEFIAEEVVRTLVGSITLVLAVPIATLIAAWYFSKYPSKNDEV